MHDPEFEKKVQQKMEELEFSPSEAVWTNLERRINTDKKRRLPLFWLFFLPGLLLGAGGAYIVLSPASHTSGTRGSNPVAVIATPATAPITTPSDKTVPAPMTTPADRTVTATASMTTPANRTVTATTSTQHPGPTIPGGAFTASAIHQRTGSVPSSAPAYKASIYTAPAPTEQSSATPSTATTSTAERSSATPITTLSSATPSTTPSAQEKESFLKWAVPGSIASVGEDRNADPAIRWGTTSPVYPKCTVDHLAGPRNAQPAKTTAPYRSSAWEAGFAGGGGLSTVAQGLVQRGNTNMAYNAPPASLNAPPLTQAAAPAQKYSTHIQPDFSFWAGIFAQKPLGKRLSLSVGLNLHYYSTLIETGQQVSSYAATSPSVTSSLFYSTAVVPTVQSYPYYPAGNSHTFTNRYYFLELPVGLQWQLNRGRKTPLFWEAGLSVSRLMSSSALYYDGSTGVYYKNRAGSAQTQLNASTAFMIGMSVMGSRVQFGPQLQYGLTSLLSGSTGISQHLLYGGIKFTLVPGPRRGSSAAR
jgi:hypothetical protein